MCIRDREKPGYFVGFAHNVGDHLTFKILKEDMRTVLHRSVVRSANDPGHRNKRVHFKSDMEQVITGMDAKTPRTHKPRRKEDMEVDVEEDEDNISSRTRSQDNLGDIASRTRSRAAVNKTSTKVNQPVNFLEVVPRNICRSTPALVTFQVFNYMNSPRS